MPKRIRTAESARRLAGRLAADRTRSGSRDPFYNRKAWKRLRAWYLAQPGNAFCAECRRRGYLKAAAVVDHIVPRQSDPGRELDPSNLQGLCRACDNRKRARDCAAGLVGRGAKGVPKRGPVIRDITGEGK